MAHDIGALNLQTLARALGGEISNGQVKAPGPGHSAADRSMSVKLDSGAPDGFVVNCFSPADDPIKCKDYIREKIGLPAFKPNSRQRMSDDEIGRLVMAAAMGQSHNSTPKGKIVATYDYTDADGQLLYQVARLEPKDFRQRRPDGKGGWIWKLDDRRVLYRLPELSKFPDATVFVCEGEKDTDRVADLGLCATCVAAGKWTPECVAALKDREVIILEDNDDAGRKKALAAAHALYGTAKTIRIVSLPGLVDKGDVSDWLDADPHNAEKLASVCFDVPVWGPDSNDSDNITIKNAEAETPDGNVPNENIATKSELGEWDAGDDTELPPPRGWLLGNTFCRGFMSSLLGDGGVGKTALRYAQILSSATGRQLTGEYVFQRCRVLIVSLEDDEKELKRRILAALLYHKIDRSELKGRLFLATPGASGGKLMTIDNRGRIVRDDLANKLEAVIVARKIDLLFLDPFVKAHSVDENNNSAIDDVVQILTDLGAKYNIAVDSPHHISKGAADPGNASRGRGASAYKDAGRLVYTASPMSAEESQAFGVSEEERCRLIRIDSAKVNITPPMSAAKWFRLVSVPIGNATEMYPSGDNVQTVEPWIPPDTWADLSVHLLNKILTVIDNGLPDGNRYTDGNRAETRAAWKVITEHAPTKTEGQAREVIKTWIKNRVLVRHQYDNPATRKPVAAAIDQGSE